LQSPAGSRKKKVRVGRGIGSKLGKTAGSGNKGQKSRRGYSRRRGFEGGQMPLHRRMPKRGFHNPFGVTYSVVNLEELNVFPAGETVTPELLRAHGFVRRATDPIKVLGDGELTSKLAIHAHAFSASARKRLPRRAHIRGCSLRGIADSRMKRFVEAVKNMFRIQDLRNRVLFTLALLAVYRIGAYIPIPGINSAVLDQLFNQAAGSVLASSISSDSMHVPV